MARTIQTGPPVRPQSARRPGIEYRCRNASAVRTFGLRSFMRIYVGRQQAPAPRSSRREAGRRAWATRIAKYGPSGRKPMQRRQMPRRARHPRMQLQVVVTTTSQPGDQPLALDEAPHLDTSQRRQSRTPIPSLPEDDAPVLDNDDVAPVNEIGRGPGVNDLVDLDPPSTSPPPASVPRPALAEVTLPPPAPSIASPARPPPTANTEADEMTRLLDERRARLLGPQNITQPPREPRPIGLVVFNDPPTNESEQDIGIEDKENEEPDWSGSDAPPAPGPQRLESSVLAEVRPSDAMGSAQDEPRGRRWFGGFFG